MKGKLLTLPRVCVFQASNSDTRCGHSEKIRVVSDGDYGRGPAGVFASFR